MTLHIVIKEIVLSFSGQKPSLDPETADYLMKVWQTRTGAAAIDEFAVPQAVHIMWWPYTMALSTVTADMA